MRTVLLLIALLQTTFCFSQDSIYNLAWDNHNSGKYSEAALLFEQIIGTQHSDSVNPTYHLNAASSWACAENKEKTFENLNKMVNRGFLERHFLIWDFGEFYKYQDSEQWKLFIENLDNKRNELYKLSETLDFQKLTKEQMYMDFDSLVSTINMISPQKRVREKVCNVDYKKNFSKLRNEIKTIQTSDTFALLLKRVLISCQDGHTSLSGLNPFSHLSNGKSLEFCAQIAKYEILFAENRISDKNLPKLVYQNGKYYLSEDFTSNNIVIKKSAELISVNNINPVEYIMQNFDRKRRLHWDFANQWFYSESFLQLDIKTNQPNVSLKFDEDGKQKSIIIEYLYKSISTNDSKATKGFVNYFEKEKLLYIKIPRMVIYEGLYANEILKYKDNEIGKVIIDIRDNPGGGDDAWYQILYALTGKSYYSEISVSYTKENSKMDKRKKGNIYNKFQEFNLNYFSTNTGFQKEEMINLTNMSYSDNIYVLYNDKSYSSAGSFVNMCLYSDELISVGVQTGEILGFGIDPRRFSLPNSNINFRITEQLDVSKVETYRQLFHDLPEIEVKMTIEEKIQLKNNNTFSKEYLLNQDPYIKVVLEN